MSKSSSAPLRTEKWGLNVNRRFGRRLGPAGGLRQRVANNPAALAAKVEIRSNVLNAIGADKARVFDAFAGEGQLYSRVWSKAQRYVGCDLKWYRDGRELYVGDSRNVMRAIDLAPFNVFDFDSHGSPWEHVLILCARRLVTAGEQIGVTFTEGSRVDIQYGHFSAALAQLIGVQGKAKATGMARDKGYHQLLDRVVTATARRLNCSILYHWQARPPGRGTRLVNYVGLVLEGLP
jgi:hypothetical protein